MNDPTESRKKRTKKLFKQHTELEILVSAAIVFAAVNSQEVVLNLTYDFLNSNFASNSYIMGLILLLGLIGATIFPISIITHLILRSYWLALVGLRLAYEDQAPKALNLNERYKKIIEKYLDIDLQIKRMDRLTSSVFSFSFLVLFSFLFSLVFFLTAIQVINQLSPLLGDSFVANAFLITLMVSLLVTSLLYAVDFFGMGILKRIPGKWFHRLYYPVYRFYSAITFASLYRGIYYTLLSNVSKKVVMAVLPLYVIVTLVLINLGYNSYLYYPSDYDGPEDIENYMYLSSHYRDELDNQFNISRPVIPSRNISEDDHIRLFIPFDLSLEDSIAVHCDHVVPFDNRGFHWNKNFTISGITDEADTLNGKRNALAVLQCISDKVRVSVNDSVYTNLTYRFSRLITPEKSGVETVFSIKWLGTGNHLVKVESKAFFGENGHQIPFWRD